MFSIRGNSIGIVLVLLFLQTFAVAEYSRVNSLSSNEILAADGNGDTVWVVTSHGVNFSTNITSDTVAWSGFQGVDAFNISFSNGYAIAYLKSNENNVNSIFVYNHQTDLSFEYAFPFKPNLFYNSSDQQNNFLFHVVDAAWEGSGFWLAGSDGGLLKFNPNSSTQEDILFIPGRNKKAYSASGLNPTITGSNPDKNRRINSVASSNDGNLWVGCEDKLWKFNISDTVWDSIAVAENYLINNITISKNDSTTLLISLLESTSSDSKRFLYAYGTVTGIWKKIVLSDIANVASGYKNDVIVQRKSNLDNVSRYYIGAIDSIQEQVPEFTSRFDESGTITSDLEISDLYFSTLDSDTLLIIATNLGLFYSKNEYADEISNRPFKYQTRLIQVGVGLKSCYSYPSIITGESDKVRAYFAYNLKSDANVTIDIFDFNMDFVVRIIDNENRLAGYKNSSGRSSDKSRDHWDGTSQNNGGRSVAPGVYFFRIKADNGEKAFGKVIVAK